MKSDKEFLLSVSRVAMRLLEALGLLGGPTTSPSEPHRERGLETRKMCGRRRSPRSPLVDADDDLPPEVIGVLQGAFQWT